MEDPSPLPAAYPRWIFLVECFQMPDTETVPPPATYPGDDSDTVAHARTSKGRHISVSFLLAAPPAVSRLYLHSPGMPLPKNSRAHAIAAHGDSVLIKTEIRSGDYYYDDDGVTSDYFLYCAGNAAADPSRPPSLSLLPACLDYDKDGRPTKEQPYLDEHGTALLRRGQDEVPVAGLDSWVEEGHDGVLEAKLCLLRSDKWEWELKRLPIVHDEGKRQEVSSWETDRVIPVGDRFLLWADYLRGIIYSDLSQEMPELRYVSLPVDSAPCRPEAGERGTLSNRSVCATDGGRAVRFVDVLPRCCCGCHVATYCAVSGHAYTIHTWALRMDDMTTWDKVCVVDCHDLWSLPGYRGVVPRIKPEYPIVSLEDPHLLCFKVHKTIYDKGVDGDLGTRLIELDTRRMDLRSTCYYDPLFYFFSNFVVSDVSQYFDSSSPRFTPARRIDDKHYLEIPARPLLKLTLSASPEEMLATLQEIPNLARHVMTKAYSILSRDESQFKFRSLLALPMDMRKDYCLLVTKLSSFDV